MVKLGVLECPECGQLSLRRLQKYDDRESLKQVAGNHLREHHLDESKHGIFRVMMVERLDQIEVERPTDCTIGEWVKDDARISVEVKHG